MGGGIVKVVVGDGKYTFETKDGDYRVHVLRYGVPWLIIYRGCNAVAQMMYELEEARENAREQSQADKND